MSNVIVLDTEFAGSVENYKTTRVYDFGFVVMDRKTGDIIRTFNWTVREIFYNDFLMGGAYYADKLPQYRKEIAAGTREVKNFGEIKRDFEAICWEYNVKQVWAYNATADKNALNGTCYVLSNGICREFLPRGVEWCDIWGCASSLICNTMRYFKFAEKYGLESKSGNCSTNAENVYRFLANDASFIEKHTALSDAMIEAEILFTCFRKKKKLNKELTKSAWCHPQKGYKAYKKSLS